MTRSAPLRALFGLLAAGLVMGCGSAPTAAPAKLGDQLAFGVEMAQRGLWNEAMFRFEQARALEPRDRRVLNNLAVSYEAVGRFEDALAAYKSALEAAPGDRKLRQNYTRFLEFYQNYKVRKPADPAASAAAPETAPAPPAESPAPPPAESPAPPPAAPPSPGEGSEA
jgi:tetratricopeptide (TPR) repeat protein